MDTVSFVAVAEDCQSGRMGLSRKQVCQQWYRGFESLILRQKNLSVIRGLFFDRNKSLTDSMTSETSPTK